MKLHSKRSPVIWYGFALGVTASGPISVQVERRGQAVCVLVRDQGIGIPAAVQSQLFQRFYRASNAAERNISGFGIGLYLLKEIVTRHGGTVEVSSIEEQGNTFTIQLPAAKSTANG